MNFFVVAGVRVVVVMDRGKEISMDAAIKMMNDQAHYEVRRNVCLAVLLYFGTPSFGAN